MKKSEIFVVFIYLLIIALKIALLVWLYKIGYLLHYFIIAIVLSLFLFPFIKEKKKVFPNVNTDSRSSNNEKISQKDTSETLKVLKNVSIEDKTVDNYEDISDEKEN